MRRPIPLVFLLFAAAATLGANPGSNPASAPSAASASTAAAAPKGALWPDTVGSPEALIGLDPKSVLARLGPPDSLGTARGAEPWQDDAIFIYAYGLRLSWFGDRIWQVHTWGSAAPAILGLRPGDSVDKALSLLGEPDYGETPDAFGRLAWEWKLPGSGWPLRLRALAREGVLEDIYVYRSDF